jgi:hypothetical protein
MTDTDCDGSQCDTAIMPAPIELQQPAAVSLAPPSEPNTRDETQATGKISVQFASEKAAPQKRPIRPLPPPSKRQITVSDSSAQPSRPRPIRPQPPVPRGEDPTSLTLPAITAPVAPTAEDSSGFEMPAE